MSRKLYFAHPVTDYGTVFERLAVGYLRDGWLWPEIVNPNREDWAAAYKQFGMQFFIDRCGECDGVAFVTFPNGKIGAGVAAEVRSFINRGIPHIYRLSRQLDDLRLVEALNDADVLSVAETREMIAALRVGSTPVSVHESPVASPLGDAPK